MPWSSEWKWKCRRLLNSARTRQGPILGKSRSDAFRVHLNGWQGRSEPRDSPTPGAAPGDFLKSQAGAFANWRSFVKIVPILVVRRSQRLVDFSRNQLAWVGKPGKIGRVASHFILKNDLKRILRAEKKFGAVAQLGERSVRNAEVEGSIPFRSTYPVRTYVERHQ